MMGAGAILADPTLAGLRADAWAAIGAWLTLLVTAVLALYALGQLRESRALREQNSRPYVIVDVEFRQLLIELVVRNIGTSAATDVVIRPDEPFTSSSDELGWRAGPAFTTGIPMLAPGRAIRFYLDSFITRKPDAHSDRMGGTVTYGWLGHSGDRLSERYEIDLSAYHESQVDEPGVPEIARELEQLRRRVESVTSGSRLNVLSKTWQTEQQELAEWRRSRDERSGVAQEVGDTGLESRDQ